MDPSPRTTHLPGRVLPSSIRCDRTQPEPSSSSSSPTSLPLTPLPVSPKPASPKRPCSPDTDSDDEIMSLNVPQTTNNGIARVITGTSSKNCLKITDGKLTHATFQWFLTAAQNWRKAYHPTVAETEIMPYLTPGFCDNPCLDDFYYQNSKHHNKLTPSKFIEVLWTRLYGTYWYLDVCHVLDNLQQGEGSFADLYDTIGSQNCLLEGNQKDALNKLKRAHTNAFQSNSAVTAPISSSHAFPPFPSHTYSAPFYNPNIAALSASSQPQFQVQPTLQYTGGQIRLAPRFNELEKWLMFFLAHFCINCCFPFQNHHKSDNICDPCPTAGYKIQDVNFINHWVQAHPNGFENCHVPDPNVTPRQPRMITNKDIVHAMAHVQANNSSVPQFFLNFVQTHAHSSVASSSNAVPLGQLSHVTPIQPIPQNFVAPIIHSHSFPPSNELAPAFPDMKAPSRPPLWAPSHAAHMPQFSNCTVVGVDGEDNGYIDVDSGNYDEPLFPPAHNVRPWHSCSSLSSSLLHGHHVADVLLHPAQVEHLEHGRWAETEPLWLPSGQHDHSGSRDVSWKAHTPAHSCRT
ncbi:uncharacterized protein EV420DRAFT_1766618 [Desarmillaria tabescens]|uniref:Uncharacterized protein n=1 Tax=Armillaria tabescens TaxID=1929756 RepID=A0AA39K1N7_ARMTA|nr:uncharacterized protein EV420DRAFT_1766618 [Desarmillaria tabescens]KAK0450538.1 hypothetical protein EV420DRAFT_1766618 [Desarmillaria tabescens]